MQILSPKGEYFISTGMGQDMTNAHHFRTASCTKTFTAAAIMLLHQRGKLNIEDKITDSIPGTNTPYVPTTADFNIPNKDQITIRMLLMHRAGVFDVTNDELPDSVPAPYGRKDYPDVVLEQDPNHQFTLDELIGVDAAYRLSYPFAPGSDYHYSNTGYSILGKIIERVSGKTYGDFVKTELMVPNGLLEFEPPRGCLRSGAAVALCGRIYLGWQRASKTSRSATCRSTSPRGTSSPPRGTSSCGATDSCAARRA